MAFDLDNRGSRAVPTVADQSENISTARNLSDNCWVIRNRKHLKEKLLLNETLNSSALALALALALPQKFASNSKEMRTKIFTMRLLLKSTCY